MTLNKKQLYTILNFILLLVLGYFIYYQYIINNQNNNNQNNKHILDAFENSKMTKTCTLNINDLDHRTLDEYKHFDGKIVKCGKCSDAILKMNISTCAIDANGSPVLGCSPNGPVGSIDMVTNINNMVYNENVIFNNKANPGNINRFFCLE